MILLQDFRVGGVVGVDHFGEGEAGFNDGAAALAQGICLTSGSATLEWIFAARSGTPGTSVLFSYSDGKFFDAH